MTLRRRCSDIACLLGCGSFTVVSQRKGETDRPSTHNVETTLIQRWFDVQTLNRRCFYMYTTLKQRRFNVDSSSRLYQRWIDVVSTLCTCWGRAVEERTERNCGGWEEKKSVGAETKETLTCPHSLYVANSATSIQSETYPACTWR